MARHLSSFGNNWRSSFLFLILSVLLIAYNAVGEINNGVVETIPSVNLRNGTKGFLPCNISSQSFSVVFWAKGSKFDEANEIIYLDIYFNHGEKGGPGFEAGSFDITADFSLIIKDVTFPDAGKYFCHTTERDSLTQAWDATNVTVFVPPMEPFPIFEECLIDTNKNEYKQNCSINTTLHEVNMTCSVTGYYPHFEIYLHNKTHSVHVLDTKQHDNIDGTKSKSITIRAVTGDDPYTCVASGIGPSGEWINRTSTVFLQWNPAEVPPKTFNDWPRKLVLLIVMPIVIVIICINSVVFYIKSRRSRRYTAAEGSASYAALSAVNSDGTMPTLTAAEVTQCRAQLSHHYTEILGRIKTSPLDTQSAVNINDIYTKLFLLKEVVRMSIKEENLRRRALGFYVIDPLIKEKNLSSMLKQTLLDDEFKKMISPESPPYRILLVGEAGAGKTTFLTKLVNDWMMGHELNTTKLLFHIPLVDAERHETFSKCIEKYLSDENDCVPRLDEHIRRNQREVMFVFDGLDEYKGDITQNDPNNALNQIMRGEKYKESVVILMTRPWRADQIVGNEKLKKLFTFVSIEGFDETSAKDYVSKFFKDDELAAKSLIQFLDDDHQEGGIFSTEISSDPIYLAMLCHMWRDTSRKNTIINLVTVSQFVDEMAITLKEHYAAKEEENKQNDAFHKCMKRIDKSFEEVGELAYAGVFARSLVIKESRSCSQASIDIAYKVGILTREKRMASKQARQQEGKRYYMESRFPHKLLQDYLAAVYISSLFQRDRAAFNVMLCDLLSRSKQDLYKFEYIWYFIATRGKYVGRAVMEFLLHVVTKQEFILRVAFEYHDKDIIAEVINAKFTERSVRLETKRSFAGHHLLFLLAKLLTMDTLYVHVLPESKMLARTAAQTIFTLERLRAVVINDCRTYSEEFYTALNKTSLTSILKIQILSHYKDKLGACASMNYARAICVMTRLQVLELWDVKLDDVFYTTMAQASDHSQIETLILFNSKLELGPSASRDLARSILHMQNLRNLWVKYSRLDNTFYQTLADGAAHSRIKKMVLVPDEPLACDASESLMNSLSSMVNLNTLLLDAGSLDDSCFSALTRLSSDSRIEKLRVECMDGRSINAARDLVKGISSMPSLHTLYMHRPGHGLLDELCSVMVNTHRNERLSTIVIKEANLAHRNLRALLSIKILRTVCFIQVTAEDVDSTSDDGNDVDAISDEQTESSGRSDRHCSSRHINIEYPVKEIRMDDASLRHLLQLGLKSLLTNIDTIQLDFTQDVTNDVMDRLQQFPSLVKLYITPYREHGLPSCEKSVALQDTSGLCKMITTFRDLTTLRFTDVNIRDDDTIMILEMTRSHRSLDNVIIRRCGTTNELDPLCEQISSETGKMVTVFHGMPNTQDNWNDDKYADYLHKLDHYRFDDKFTVRFEEYDQ